MSKKSYLDCKSGNEIDHCVQCDPNVRSYRQEGSHVIVKGPNPGSAVYPKGCKDMPIGTLRSVIRMFKIIGLISIIGLLIILTLMYIV